MTGIFRDWLIQQGMTDGAATNVGWLATGLAVFILALASNYIARRFLLTGISYFVKKTRTEWDDALMKRKVFTRLSHLAPALVIYFTADLFGPLQGILQRLSMVYMIIVGLIVFDSFVNAIVDIYNTYPIARQKPIKGYAQVVKIVLSIFIVIVAVAVLMNRSPWMLLSGFGAMTAVLLLVFKDTILGLVASIQLSMNDMVQIGDWIEMPKFGADGDVIDVTLHTVKVQNWDKTIVTIPSYSMISDSFKNWRGMSESGGRRIKRALDIDLTSVKFCTAEILDRYEKFQLIADYIKTRREEITLYNVEHQIDTSELVNGRNMTNLGTFRAYASAYLRNHPKVHQGMTFLIRYLTPGDHGQPLEIYVFSNDQDWARYEGIQADIFDHLFAVVPLFDLRLFQSPSGNDVRALVGKRE